jgi:hypothetical protein
VESKRAQVSDLRARPSLTSLLRAGSKNNTSPKGLKVDGVRRLTLIVCTGAAA